MAFQKSTAYAALGGIVAGWASMGVVWLSCERSENGDATEDSGSVVTMVDSGQEARGRALPPGIEIDDPRISFRQLDRLAEDAALADPVIAARSSEKIPGYDNREKYFGTVLRTWGETDGRNAAEWALQEYKGEKLSDALYYVADGWAESDPEAAGEWFLAQTDGVILEDAVWEVLEAWGRKDPEKALAWSEKLDDYTKSSVLFGLAEGWGAVDPVAAAKAGMQMEGGLRQEFLTSVATQWAGSDPEALGRWAQSLDSESLRASILSEMGEIWGESDPAAATEWIGSLENESDRIYFQNGMGIGWSEHDPGGALEWVIDNVKNPQVLSEMVGDIVFNWTNLDPAGTTEWLEQRPAGSEKDAILEMFSDGIVSTDPMAAVAWANEISDAEKRDRHLRQMASEWVAMDGLRALQGMREIGIPEDVIQSAAN